MAVRRAEAPGQVDRLVDDDAEGNVDALCELVNADLEDRELDGIELPDRPVRQLADGIEQRSLVPADGGKRVVEVRLVDACGIAVCRGTAA